MKLKTPTLTSFSATLPVGRELGNGCVVSFATGDATKLDVADKSVDLVFGSPPYLKARTYGINAQRAKREWVDFMVACTREALRVSRGLVLWVVAGTTDAGRYSPGPEALMDKLDDDGVELWRPACWHKVDPVTNGGTGQPGSGGKQWLRSDWEYVVACKRPGPLSFADPLFEKRLPKYAPGGKIRTRAKDGSRNPRAFKQPSYTNPGNVIKAAPVGFNCPACGSASVDVFAGEASDIVKARVGGGHQGDKECHESEAPFPEKLAGFFVRAFCPAGGWVYDPFSGSGTTAVTAGFFGRNGYGTDIRESQVDLALRRLDRRIAEGRAIDPRPGESA